MPNWYWQQDTVTVLLFPMKYLNYFFGLDQQQQQQYALRCGTTLAYLTTHIFVNKSRRKIPRRNLIDSLWKNSRGAIDLDDVLEFLYKEEEGRKAAWSQPARVISVSRAFLAAAWLINGRAKSSSDRRGIFYLDGDF